MPGNALEPLATTCDRELPQTLLLDIDAKYIMLTKGPLRIIPNDSTEVRLFCLKRNRVVENHEFVLANIVPLLSQLATRQQKKRAMNVHAQITGLCQLDGTWTSLRC